jgi:hypothetical protein
MKKLIFSLITYLTLTVFVNAQNVAINATGATASASAMLDVSSSNSGVLIPRVALTGTTSAAPVTAPTTSLLVYNTATVSDVTPGFYYWSGSAWVRFLTGASNAWNLTGNAGINPATNFIGTTDAQPWIVRTSNTERVRILSAGNILFNRTTALYATDLFEAQGNATFPDAINGYTDQATGSGVYGECSAGAGIGVIGVNSTATAAGTGPGVYGQSNQTGAAGVWGSGGTVTRGVLGSTNNATYGGTQGQNAHIDGDGVVGINSAASGVGVGTGVFGQCSQGGGAAAGVYGYNDHTAGAGIIGYNGAAAGAGNGRGVIGVTAQSGGSAAGVYAANTNAAGEGFMAFNTAATGTNVGDAVYAQTAQSQGFGVFAINTHTSGTGCVGGGNNVATISYLTTGSGGAFTGSALGSYSYGSTAATATGCGGVGNAGTLSTLTNGSGGAFSGTLTGVYGYAFSTSNTVNRYGGYFSNAANDYAYVGGRNSGTQYKIIGTGTVSTIVSDVNGKKVALACPEAPEILFMDFGHGKLINGTAHIDLDPTISKNILVDNAHPLKVFVQLEGNCNGVYVANKTATGFDVIELGNGTSNVDFTYQIVAQRADEYDENGNLVSKNVVRFNEAPLIQPYILNESKTGDRSRITNDKEPVRDTKVPAGNIEYNKK